MDALNMKYRAPPGKCPCCLAKGIMLSALNNCDDVLSEEDDGTVVVADFGIVQVRHDLDGRYSVHSYGQEVMRMTPDDLEVIKPGRWINTMVAIKADLEGRFGKVDTGHKH